MNPQKAAEEEAARLATIIATQIPIATVAEPKNTDPPQTQNPDNRPEGPNNIPVESVKPVEPVESEEPV